MDQDTVWEAMQDWRRKLFLEHWAIDLVFDVKSNDFSAQTEVIENTYNAIISFADNVNYISLRQLNELICHELLHLGHRNIYPGSIKYLKSLAPGEQQIYTDYIYDQIEQYVDSIASALANIYMPMCLREQIEDKSDPFYVKKKIRKE